MAARKQHTSWLPPPLPGPLRPEGRRGDVDRLLQPLVEIVPLVVDHDERGEILHLDPPHRFHAEFRILQHLHLADAVLRQPRRRPADAAQVEAAVFAAGVAHRLASGCPSPASPASRRRPGIRPRSCPSARPWWGRSCRWRSRSGSWPGRRSTPGGPSDTPAGPRRGPAAPSAWRGRCRAPPPWCRSASPASSPAAPTTGGGFRVHRLVQVDRHRFVAQVVVRGLRQVFRRVGLQLLQEHAVRGDLRHDLPVGAARHADPHRQRRAVARQADHPHVVTEILAAELRADADIARQLQHLLFHLQVAERVARLAAAGGQRVQPLGGGQLHRLHRGLGRGAADDDRQVVGRAGGGAERLDLGFQEFQQPLGRQDRPRLLEQERLVGAAAALGDEHQGKLVGVVLARGGQDVELHRQVVAGVDLLEHRQRRHLRVAQVGLGVGAVDAPGQRLLLVAIDPDALALLAEHDRGAGVLAHRQHAAGGDVGVLQQVQRDEAVVRAGFRIVQDRRAAAPGDPGRSRCDTSWKAWKASSLSASGAMRSTVWPSQVAVRTPSTGSRFHAVRSGPSGNIGAYWKPDGRCIGAFMARDPSSRATGRRVAPAGADIANRGSAVQHAQAAQQRHAAVQERRGPARRPCRRASAGSVTALAVALHRPAAARQQRQQVGRQRLRFGRLAGQHFADQQRLDQIDLQRGAEQRHDEPRQVAASGIDLRHRPVQRPGGLPHRRGVAVRQHRMGIAAGDHQADRLQHLHQRPVGEGGAGLQVARR